MVSATLETARSSTRSPGWAALVGPAARLERYELPRATGRVLGRRRSRARALPRRGFGEGALSTLPRVSTHAAAPRLVLLPPLLGHVDPPRAEEAPGPIGAADEAVATLARLVLRGARVRGSEGEAGRPEVGRAGQQGVGA